MDTPAPRTAFFGSKVVLAAFLMGIFAWGTGVYGPPVFLHAVIERTGWSLTFVSAMVTAHYLIGAFVITRLASLYARFGLPVITAAGAVVLAAGVFGWATAREPWHLFAASMLTGAGWVAMGAVAVNAVIAPWYVRTRTWAISLAYNGASVGGVIFSPLWAMLILKYSFPFAAVTIGCAGIALVSFLSLKVFSVTPQSLGQVADGDGRETTARAAEPKTMPALPGSALWRDRSFITLAGGMAVGLFAQIGLLSHLYSVLVPTLGADGAGYALGLTTCCAIAGRTGVARLLTPKAERRLASAGCYAVQMLGTIVMFFFPGNTIALFFGVICYGLGIGNSTSLPPLIAQQEFADQDVLRVVSLCVAISQSTYAFAPATFGFLRNAAGSHEAGAHVLFGAVAAVQGLTILCLLAGRRKR